MTERANKWILIFLMLGIAFMPFSMFGCHAALIVMVLVWLVSSKRENSWSQLLRQPLLIAYLAFFLLHLLGLLYSENLRQGFVDIERKALFFLLPVLFFTLKPFSNNQAQWLSKIFVAANLLASFWCLGAATYRVLSKSEGEVIGQLGIQSFANKESVWNNFSYIILSDGIGIHPAFFALYVSVSFLILVELYIVRPIAHGWKKVMLYVLLLYMIFFVVCLSSKIINIILMIYALYAMYRITIGKSIAVKGAGISVVIILFVCFVVINPIARYRNIDEYKTATTEFPHGIQAQSIDIRKSLWLLSTEAIFDNNMILGVGTGDVKETVKRAGEKMGIGNVLNTNDPHNQYLYTTLSLGILGLLCLALILLYPIWKAFRQRNVYYLLFSCGILLLCFTESALELQKGVIFYAIFSSLAFKYPLNESERVNNVISIS